MQALADQAAVAVQNARHYEQLERTTAQLESQLDLSRVLLELSGSLIAVHDNGDVLSRIATLARQVVDFDGLEYGSACEAQELYCGYASDEEGRLCRKLAPLAGQGGERLGCAAQRGADRERHAG